MLVFIFSNTTMPRFFHILLTSSIFSLLTTRVFAGEATAASASMSDMTLMNWLMIMPVVLILAIVFGTHYRERRSIKRHRGTILNPEHDHSTRRYPRTAGIALSAICPPSMSIDIPNLDNNVDGYISEQRLAYRKALRWITNLFGSLRVFTYLPTILTLWASADSNQYSLLTWGAWVVANASMTASIYEQNGRKVDHLVLVNACNTFMCLITAVVIFYFR